MNCTCGNFIATKVTTGPDMSNTGEKKVMVCLNCGRLPPVTAIPDNGARYSMYLSDGAFEGTLRGREAQEISIAAEGYKAQRDALRQALEAVLLFTKVGKSNAVAVANAYRVLKEMER